MTGKTVCEQLNNILCKLETEIANRETAYKGSYKGSYKGAYKACWIILTSAQVRVERLEEQGKTSERDAEHAEILTAGELEEVTLALTAIQSLVDLLAQLADEAEKLELREK